MAMDEEAGTPTPPDLERKLLTILSADVAEYSRLMAEDEEHTLRVFREHKQVFDSLVAMHRGRVFNTAGDAILAEFASAVEAVRCATEVQAALRTRNDQLPPSRQVRFRIGVNLGDVMVHGSDLMGDGVNVAARLQGAAEPGGICVSGSVYDQIRNKLSLSFTSLGERTFKNIPQPVRTFSISEAEGVGELPSSKPAERGPGGVLKWAAAAALVAALAGGYWAYAEHDRGKAELARVVAAAEAERRAEEASRREAQLAAERAAAAEVLKRAEAEMQRLEAERRAATEAAAKQAAERDRVEAERQAADRARRQADADRIRIEQEARRTLEEERRKAEAARRAAVVPSQQQVGAAAGGLGFDGTYGGPVCLGPTPTETARCFRAAATLAKGKITGAWPGLEERTNTLLGAVTETGEVMMRWVTRRPDGTIYGLVDLEGTLRDGQLNASGTYRSGRTASFQWKKE
jgi:adenylate cyclase